MQLPKISIITVVFNGADTILPTIRSVSALTYPNLEFIIIDGASNDGTLAIIKENEPTITQWISEPDNGLYDAMNKGMDLATGDYFWFINSGDEPASEDVLEGLFDRNPADVYYGETLLINPDGSEIGLRRLSPPEKLNWRHFRQGMLVSHQAFIASRKVAKKYDLRYKFSADFDWCIYALKHASAGIRNTGKVLCRFREGGLTKQNILPGLKERFRIMVKYYGLIPSVFSHFVIAPKFFWYWARNKRF